MNRYLVTYYLRTILPTEENYKIYSTEQLAIVEGFKTGRHFFEKAVHKILILTNHNNKNKFMEITRVSY